MNEEESIRKLFSDISHEQVPKVKIIPMTKNSENKAIRYEKVDNKKDDKQSSQSLFYWAIVHMNSDNGAQRILDNPSLIQPYEAETYSPGQKKQQKSPPLRIKSGFFMNDSTKAAVNPSVKKEILTSVTIQNNNNVVKSSESDD
ncbi:MAG: hypothetical protein EZS28_048376, partial [Streblomastix strix]